jgi:hypothetical protein
MIPILMSARIINYVPLIAIGDTQIDLGDYN